MTRTINSIIIMIFFAVSTHSRSLTVAKNGGDYVTIMSGLNAADAGDTVFVKGGIYNEIVKWPKSGSLDKGYITLIASGDSPAVIDGSSFSINADNAELILINDKSFLAIIGMEICNCVTSSEAVFNKGIQIEGSSSNILIRNCKIHNIENNYTSENGGANAIGVFGRNKDYPVRGIIIDSCEIYQNKTCYSEAVSIDGNVDDFRITNNHIHDNNNIGILFAGYYGECENCGVFDQARHGIISDNLVERCTSCDNAAYKGDCSAGGIYSDGGGKTIIERNIIRECDIGIEAGAELAGSIDDSVVIRDNIISNCNIGGIYIGGYEKTLGWTTFCKVVNNTLYMNDIQKNGSGEIMIQKAHDISIINNIFYTSNQNVAVSKAFSDLAYCYNVNVSNNLFYSGSQITDIEGALLDPKSILADPLFVNTGIDFHLKPLSPAINRCDTLYVPESGEFDFDKNNRKAGTATDIGAFEFISVKVRHVNLMKSGGFRNHPSLIINTENHNSSKLFILKNDSKKKTLLNGQLIINK